MSMNKGFSLVELIVALAVFAIAGISVFGFMTYSSNNYTRTNSNIKLQYEQQLTVNQIRDEILEASRAIYYDSSAKVLIIYGGDIDSLGNVTYPVKKITYKESENRLYIAEKIFTDVDDIKAAEVNDSKLLAENISAFSVDLSKVKRQKVRLTITFGDMDIRQTVTPVIALRNELKVTNETEDIYSNTKIEVKSFIKSITIHRGSKSFSQADTDIIKQYENIEGYVSVQYRATVTATEDSTREYAVLWSVEATNTGISVNSNGVVTISNSVLSGTSFKLKAVSIDDPMKYAELSICVENYGVYPESAQLEITNIYDGNGYREYTLTPTLIYTDGTKSIDTSLFTWIGVNSIPAGCNFDEKKGILYLTEKANGYVFQINVIAKEMDANNKPVVSNIIEISIGIIPPYKSGPTLNLSRASLKRGGFAYPGVSWTNANNSDFTYYWEISPYNDAESAAWGEGKESFSECISLSSPDKTYASESTNTKCVTGSSYRYISVKCNTKLNWEKAFKIKISVYAKDKKGNVYRAKDSFISISPVSVILTPTDYAINSKKTVTDMIIKSSDQVDYAIKRLYTYSFDGLYVTGNNPLNMLSVEQNSFLFYNSADELISNRIHDIINIYYLKSDMVIGYQIGMYDFYKWKDLQNRPTSFKYTYYIKDQYGNEATSNELNYKINYE